MKARVYHLERELWLPVARDEVFAFFSNPVNLELLTPEAMRLRILSPQPLTMRAGTLIDFAVQVHSIPMRWRSEITLWEPPLRFIDEQRRGPYGSWKHEHRFECRDGGTLIVDDVHYTLPLGWIPGSGLVHSLLVQPELERVFKHRRDALLKHFNLGENSLSK